VGAVCWLAYAINSGASHLRQASNAHIYAHKIVGMGFEEAGCANDTTNNNNNNIFQTKSHMSCAGLSF